MKIKNVMVYTAAIKECLDLNGYKKDGDNTLVPDFVMDIGPNTITMGYSKPNTKVIDNQAILIKTKSGTFYRFKLTNTFFDNLKIIFGLATPIYNKPYFDGDIFYNDKTLTPYYEDEQKKLCLRKLQKDLLLDSRIKLGVEH